MSDPHPTTPTRPDKPAKPRPDFPLFPHAAGVWAKKIRGKMHYFGPWADPDGALAKYLEQKDALHAGRKPREPTPERRRSRTRPTPSSTPSRARLDAGELSPRTWREYKTACDEIVACFGKTRLLADVGPDDFADLRHKMAAKWGPVRLGNQIQYVRSVFKYAYEAGLIDRPAGSGPASRRPSKKTLRLKRAKQGPKLFTADEVRRMIDGAGTPLKAMVLLGVNCGFGNADVGRLPLSAVRPGQRDGSTSPGRKPAFRAAARSGRKPSRPCGRRWRVGRTRRTRPTRACSS